MKKTDWFNRALPAVMVMVLMTFIFGIITLCYAPTSDPWDGTTWDVTAPDILQPIGNDYKEIYDLRKGVALRMNREHQDMAAASAGGWHEAGSAVCYIGTGDPCDRPDDLTSLDSTVIGKFPVDWGRLWIDDNYDPPVLRRWNGTNFTEMVSAHIQHATACEFVLESTEALGTTDGTGDSKISAVGYKAAAGDCDLGYIKFSHDGTGADQKGAIDFYVNDGDDDNAPSKHVLEMGSDQLATFSGAVTVAGLTSAGLTSAGQVESTGAIIGYGTLSVDGAVDVNGAVTHVSTTEMTGDVTVNTDKLTVDAATGNTLIAGTLDVTGVVTGGAGSFFKYSGATVFSDALVANTWTSCDCSAVVGANRALCFIKVSASAASYWRFGVNETSMYHHTYYVGGDTVSLGSSSDTAYFTVMTHSDGTFKHYSSTTPTITIVLLGYVK